MIKIITDSGADLTDRYLKEHPNLKMLNLKTTYKGKSLEKTSREEFYKILKTIENEFPQTSQISIEEYINAFRKNKNNEIIYISIGSGYSGTMNTANIAKGFLDEEFDTSNIHIYDSETLTGKQTMLVDIAYEMAEQGSSVQEIIKALDNAKDKIIFSVLVENLKYLYAGGRISKTEAAFATVLNIRPILTTKDNKPTSKAKVRGMKNGIEYMLNEIEGKNVKKLFITRCEETPLFKEFVSKINVPYTILEMGPVIATHGGPECFGISALID